MHSTGAAPVTREMQTGVHRGVQCMWRVGRDVRAVWGFFMNRRKPHTAKPAVPRAPIPKRTLPRVWFQAAGITERPPSKGSRAKPSAIHKPRLDNPAQITLPMRAFARPLAPANIANPTRKKTTATMYTIHAGSCSSSARVFMTDVTATKQPVAMNKVPKTRCGLVSVTLLLCGEKSQVGQPTP